MPRVFTLTNTSELLMIVRGRYYKLSCAVAPKLMIVFILQHLLFSVTDPQYRAKPPGVSDVSSI